MKRQRTGSMVYVVVSLTEMHEQNHSEHEIHGIFKDQADAVAEAQALISSQGDKGEEDEPDKWFRDGEEMLWTFSPSDSFHPSIVRVWVEEHHIVPKQKGKPSKKR